MAPVIAFEFGIRSSSSILPLYISLYDFLNDDSHGIRENSAVIVAQNVVHRACPMIPQVAGELLARELGQVFPTEILEPAVAKIMGGKHIKQVIDEAKKDNDALFTREKQNLWVDDVGEIGLWKSIIEGVLIMHQGAGGMEIAAIIGRLLAFVRDGIGALMEYRSGIGGKEESPLGWTTSSEDVFVLGWRVFAALGIVKTWRRHAPVGSTMTTHLDDVWLEVVELEKRYGGKGLFEDASI